MNSLSLHRIAVAGFLLFFVLVAVVIPTLRLRRRTGTTGYVAHLATSGVHRLAVEGLRAFVFGLIAWTGAFVSLAPERLGIWTLPASVAPAGFLLMVVGCILVVLAQTQMGTSWRVGIDTRQRTSLVTHGLFAYVRNPIFSGMLMASLGLVAVTPSPWTVMGWLFLAFVLGLQTRLEEEHLLRSHGDAYARYAARVGRFLPPIGRLTPPVAA